MNIVTPLKAIRKKCLECSYNQPSEVRKCPMKNCALYNYRTGHRPTENTEIFNDTEYQKA